MDNADDMSYPSQLVPDDGCGDAGDVGFLQNADSDTSGFPRPSPSSIVFSALSLCSGQVPLP